MPLVSRETEARFRVYQKLLHKWQEKINLVSPTTLDESWERHFVDSLQILPCIPQDAKTLYDLGSGAGFPGLVFAITRPELSVTLIESDAKKCAFLSAVSRETNASVNIQNKRIENTADDLAVPDVITARALAPLVSLFCYVRPWMQGASNTTLIFPKGAQWQSEIEQAQEAGWIFEYNAHISQTDPQARILTITDLRKTI